MKKHKQELKLTCVVSLIKGVWLLPPPSIRFVALFTLCVFQSFASIRQIVIHWSSETTAGHANLLKDINGDLLSAGTSNNGDGCLVTLGYFDNALATGNPFAGNWIPLTFGTRLGDSSSGYGFEDGMFSFTTVFSEDSDTVSVYPYRPASYTVTSDEPITVTAPPSGTPICIRFYDGTDTGLSARYNTVTGPNWVWPAFSDKIPQNLYLKISDRSQEPTSLWQYGSDFEDNDNKFITGKTTEFNLTVNSTDGGSVNDANGSYEYLSVVELNASANDHKIFIGWLGDGVSDPTSDFTTISMTQDRNVTAVFDDKLYNLVVNPHGNGSVAIDGSSINEGNFTYGTIVSIEATPATGHLFSHWLGFGPDSNSSSSTLTISQDHMISAVFEPQPLDLNVSTFGNVGGDAVIVSPSDYHYEGNYTIQATPDPGYAFSHWSSPTGSTYMLDSNTSSITSLILTADSLFEAHFTLTTYELEVLKGSGGESVTPPTGEHSSIAMVSVSAQALEGYEFTGWSDPSGVLVNPNLANTEANMSQATGDVTITANFDIQSHTIQIIEEPGGNAWVTPAPPGPWEHFGVYDINASPLTGYVFTGWTGDSNSTSSLLQDASNAYNQIWLRGPVTLTANFEQKTFSIDLNDTDGGNLSGQGNYTIDDTPIIEANASTGWNFINWNGPHIGLLDDPSSSVALVDLSTAPLVMYFEANFTREQYDVNVTSGEGGLVNGESSLNLRVESESTIELSANPISGWKFSQWQGIALSDPTTPSIAFSPSTNMEIDASFSRKTFALEVKTSEFGDANGSGSYDFEARVSVSAQPHPGYIFTGWEGNTTYLDDASINTTFFNIPAGNSTITPIFQAIPYTIHTTSNGNGSIIGGGDYAPGTSITIEGIGNIADENAPRGYQLSKWSWTKGNGETGQSTENPLSLLVDNNYSITADFDAIPPNEVSYQLISNPSGAGILFDDPEKRVWDVESDLYQRIITVVPQTGFSFIGWTAEPMEIISSDWRSSIIEAIPTENSLITANCLPLTYNINLDFNASRGQIEGNILDLTHGERASIQSIPTSPYIFGGWEINKEFSYAVSRASSSLTPSESTLFLNDQESPNITLIRGFTYHFTCSLNETDLFYLTEDPNATELYSGEYLLGVSNSRTSSGTLTFEVPMDAPNFLYYSSSSNPAERIPIRVITKSDDEILPFPNNLLVEPIMEHDLSLIAKFVPQSYEISLELSEGGEVTSLTPGQYFEDQNLTLTAVADPHYEFVRWEGSSHVANQSSAETYLIVKEDTNIKAIFEKVDYVLSLSVIPPEAGSAVILDDRDSFNFGDQVNIRVIPNKDYTFVAWSSESVLDKYSDDTIVTINGNSEISASLTQKILNVDISSRTLDYQGIDFGIEVSSGSVEGPSTVFSSQPNTYNASANEGYEFHRWENDKGETISISATASLAFSESSSISAIFGQIPIEIEIDIVPSGSGEIYFGDNNYSQKTFITHGYNNSLEFNASPSDRFIFEKWTMDDSLEGDEEGQMITVVPKQNSRLVAHFKAIPPPTLEMYVSPDDGGIVFGDGLRQDPLHSIFAAAYPGYRFSHWVGTGVLDSNSYSTSVDFDENTSVTAVFLEDNSDLPNLPPIIEQNGTFTLTVQSSNPEYGGVSGSGRYGFGWTNISAQPKIGYEFKGWEGDMINQPLSENSLIFLTKDTSVTATFSESESEQDYASITKVVSTIDADGKSISIENAGGEIIGGDTFALESTPTFHAYENIGYKFMGWVNSDGDIFETNPKLSFTIQDNRIVEALFQELSFEIKINSVPTGKGFVNVNEGNWQNSVIQVFRYGEKIAITASPDENYGFIAWKSSNFKIPNPYDPVIHIDSLNQDIDLNATFSQDPPVYLTIKVAPESSGWTIGGGPHDYDPVHLIYAKANPGYLFSHWSGEGIAQLDKPDTSLILDQDKQITAHFVEDPTYKAPVVGSESGLYNLVVNPSNPEFGETFGGGVYGTGLVQVYAQPKEGYIFSEWVGATFDDSTSALTQIQLSQDSNITAIFRIKPFIEGSIELNGNWWYSDWFGLHWKIKRYDWSYHSKLGWIYLQADNQESIWIWIERLSGWFWTGRSIFPYLYEDQDGVWLLFDTELSYPEEYLLFKFENNTGKWMIR